MNPPPGRSTAGRIEAAKERAVVALIFRFLDFELDVELYEIRREGERLPVERRVVDLLLYFVRNRNRVISREEFLEGVWPDVTVRERIVDQMIYEARKVLGDDANKPRIIETIRGRGWLFVADVIESALRRWPQGSLPPGEIPFVGRKKELEALEGAMDAGREQRGSMVLITGEPGIGKSRLIEEFADRASRQGVRAYLGRCPEVDGAPPFWPWTQLLRAHRLAIGETAWEAILERTPQVGQLSRELDEKERWRTRVRPSHVGNDRFLLYDTITRFWLDVAEESPVLLLLLDDLHRADESSLQLLRYLAGEVRPKGLVVVGTSRGQIEGRAVTGLMGLRVNLSGLESRDLAEFVERASHDLGEVTDRLDPSAAGGNPFLLKTMLRTDSTDGRRLLLDRDLVLEFTCRLPHQTQFGLIAASVAGLQFDPSLVAEACEQSRDEFVKALLPAIAIGVVHRSSSEEYRFSHLLLRDSIYDALPENLVETFHARLARVLQAGNADPALLAHHFGCSGRSGDSRIAFGYLIEAGRAALGRLAIDEAHRHLTSAAGLAAVVELSGEESLDLEILLGEAEVRCGERRLGTRRLVSAAGAARAAGRQAAMAKAALAISPGALAIDIGVVDQLAVRVLEVALEFSDDLEPSMCARLRARLALALHAEPNTLDQRRDLLVAADAGEKSERAYVEVQVAREAALWDPAECVARWASLGRAAASARRVSEPELEGIAKILQITTAQEMARGADARIFLTELVDLIALSSLRPLEWYVLLYRASFAIDDGDLDRAEEVLERMDTVAGPAGGANAENAYAAGHFGLHWHRGQFDQASAVCQIAYEKYPRIHVWGCGHGLSLFRSGRVAEAEAIFDQAFEVLAGQSNRDLMWLGGVTALGDLCADLRREECAGQICRDLDPYMGRIAGVGYAVLSWGPVDRVVGRLRTLQRDYIGAAEAFSSAERVIASAKASIWTTYNQLDRADALCLTGRIEAIRVAETAIHRARELGRVRGQSALVVRSDRMLSDLHEMIGT